MRDAKGDVGDDVKELIFVVIFCCKQPIPAQKQLMHRRKVGVA